MAVAVYPGSFDPITYGHLDMIARAASLFDRLIVAVLNNPNKTPLFTVEERLRLLKETTRQFSNVEVDSFYGLQVDYLKEKGADVLIRGLRGVSDFEFESQIAIMNRELYPQSETLFLMTNPRYSFISSSLVKEIFKFGGQIDDFVPPEVAQAMKQKR